MADSRPRAHNGPPAHGANVGSGHEAPQGPPLTFARPFTLYEALPYTPFSSITPFDSGMPILLCL